MMKTISVLLIPLLASSIPAAADGIRIEKAASHSMVPGAKVGDGYLTIINESAEPDRLVSAGSPRAGNVQLHRMDMSNGVMTMRDVKDGLPIPPHSSLKLEPDYHLMFNGVAQPFRQGEQVPAILTFERAGDVTVNFTVGPIAGPLDDMQQPAHTMPMANMNMGGMDDGEMDMNAMHHEDQPEGDPAATIPHVLKTMFETPDKPLEINPVVSQDAWAVVGWRQAGRGGRVLLQRAEHGWQVHALGGDSLKTASGLVAAGVAETVARHLADDVVGSEAALDPDALKLLGEFEGTIVLAGDAAGEGHATHVGH